MKVELRCLGWVRLDPTNEPFHPYWIYLLQAANGLIDIRHDDCGYIEDGVYEMPDAEWDINAPVELGEGELDEENLLGCTTA